MTTHEYASCENYDKGCDLCREYAKGYQAGKDKLAFEIKHNYGGTAMELRREIITEDRASHRTLADLAKELYEEEQGANS